MPDRTPYEQAALDYCAPRGIRLSTFLEVWSEADQWAALEWQAGQNRRCERGHDLDDTAGPGEVDKWNARIADHCDLCRAIDREVSVITGNDEISPLSGVARWRVWRDKEDADGGVNEPSAAGSQA